jgi:DNA-binding response OmpR family regulator
MPKILVIDDSQPLVSVFDQVLRNAGYEVLSTSSSTHGLEFLRQEHVDLVILDVHMPEPDGLEILRIAKQERLAVPFIVISDHASQFDRFHRVRRLGATLSLQRPLSTEQLLESVEAALDRAHGSSRLTMSEETGRSRVNFAIVQMDRITQSNAANGIHSGHPTGGDLKEF